MGTSRSNPLLEKAVILVTDDDPDIQKITRLNLLQEGFEVVQAFTGVECLEITNKQKPDVILLDLMMPQMDGFETCKRLKSVDSTRDIPVIMVTVREAISDKLKCFSFKADDYVVKPYHFEDLLARIYLHLNQSLDRREREQKQRTAILRDVLRGLSEGIAAQYETIQNVIEKIEPQLDPVVTATLKTANHEIIHILESTREEEDPFYESPYLETEIGDEDEDIDDIMADLTDLPEPTPDN